MSTRSGRNFRSNRDLRSDERMLKSLRRREKINSFIVSPLYFVLVVLFTLYSLYSTDFRLATTGLTADNVWNAFTILTMVFFLLDIVVHGYYKPNFWRTTGFYLEILAMLSLVLDLSWIFECKKVIDWDATSPLLPAIAEIQNCSRVELSAFWYLRFLRYIRFMFLIPLFQNIIDRSDYREGQMNYKRKVESSIGGTKRGVADGGLLKHQLLSYPSLDHDQNMFGEIERIRKAEKQEEPEVRDTSRSFTYDNIRRAMYLNIAVMVLLPLFLYVTFIGPAQSAQSAADQLRFLASNNSLSLQIPPWMQHIDKVSEESSNPAVFMGVYNRLDLVGVVVPILINSHWSKDSSLYVNGSFSGAPVNPSPGFYEMRYIKSFRAAELMVRSSPSDPSTLPVNSTFVITIFSNRRNVIVDSAVSIGRTTLLIIVLLSTIFFYFNDSKKLLLRPFADMLTNIHKIEQNPMTAAREMQLQNDELEKKAAFDSSMRREMEELRKYETNILTNTLAKSGQLLALGFGEAGINIILEKLTKGSEMVGKKVICLFGFADIKYFTEVSERLKENVIGFVNEIAEVVSPIVEKYTGGTNKNLGEAFLFVWKFRDEETITMYDYDAEGRLHKNVKLKEFADKNNPITDRCDVAVLSFLECIIFVHKSPTLQKYRYDKRLNDLHGFKVRNSFGLHIGWAIEGAIGSEHKIDASYLSPNVNLASRVQYATKQFGVHILVSGMVHELLSKEIQVLMREIDCVELKGSKQAMHLWTYDMELSVLPATQGEFHLNEERAKIYGRLRKEKMISYRHELKNFHEQFYQGRVSGKTLFLSQKEVINAHRPFPKRFYDEWNTGYSLYIAGDWEAARPHFEETKNMIGGYEDKPSVVILGFLEAAKYKPPGYWKGVRHLTSK